MKIPLKLRIKKNNSIRVVSQRFYAFKNNNPKPDKPKKNLDFDIPEETNSSYNSTGDEQQQYNSTYVIFYASSMGNFSFLVHQISWLDTFDPNTKEVISISITNKDNIAINITNIYQIKISNYNSSAKQVCSGYINGVWKKCANPDPKIVNGQAICECESHFNDFSLLSVLGNNERTNSKNNSTDHQTVNTVIVIVIVVACVAGAGIILTLFLTIPALKSIALPSYRVRTKIKNMKGPNSIPPQGNYQSSLPNTNAPPQINPPPQENIPLPPQINSS